MIESAVTDLPQPDSPTMPSVLPRSTAKLTPSTARTSPDRVPKYVRRSSTSSSAIYAAPWVRGSSASRKPSAMKKAVRINHAIAMLGITMMYGCERYWL